MQFIVADAVEVGYFMQDRVTHLFPKLRGRPAQFHDWTPEDDNPVRGHQVVSFPTTGQGDTIIQAQKSLARGYTQAREQFS